MCAEEYTASVGAAGPCDYRKLVAEEFDALLRTRATSDAIQEQVSKRRMLKTASGLRPIVASREKDERAQRP